MEAAAGEGQQQPEECVRVLARVRPPKAGDEHAESIRLRGNQVEISVPRASDVVNNATEEYKFNFSHIFPPDTNQAQVFDAAAKDLVIGALDGVNCTIFAYGQTGSGKTHTICGDHRNRGIIPRSLGCIFQEIERRDDGVDYTVWMSFIEVYKEVGYDLLAKDFGKTIDTWPVVVVSLQSGQPVLQWPKEVVITSEEEGLHQYFLGDTHRCVAETPHNLNSSRSHCIFTIYIKASSSSAQTVRTSKVQIVDLAGSERLRPYESGSQNDQVLMGQAIAINLSLFSLEQVINALNTKGVVPYRNSFLTKVLKDALGGNARAVMVATINPADHALPETLSTCRFAMRVANVRTDARVNEEKDPKLVIAALRQENAELRSALAAAEATAGTGGAEEPPLEEEELRQRARKFLEEEAPGSEGGAVLRVGSLLQAFAAFRVLRELCWDLVRGRGRSLPGKDRGSAADAADEAADGGAERPAAASAEPSADAGGGQGSSAGQDAAGGAESPRALRRALDEREGECRMLRAALASQPPRAPARPARPAPVRAKSAHASTQTEGLVIKRRPKRPSSADPRPKEARKFIDFDPDSVVPYKGPPTHVRAVDPRVPDFRSMLRPPAPPPQEVSQGGSSAAEPLVASARGSPAGSGVAVAREGRRSVPAPLDAGALAAADTPAAAPTAADAPARGAEPAKAPPPAAAQASGAGASASWLKATTALTQDELKLMGDAKKAYQLFLRHDPRAEDIWQGDLQAIRQDRRGRMEEARALGEEIERTKDATQKAQGALAALQDKLREAEAEAEVDPSAAQRAATLRGLLATEEPNLTQLVDEKRQRYALDFGRLKELRCEIMGLEHAEKKLEATVQAEFAHWREAVYERYPDAASQAAPPATSQAASQAAATDDDDGSGDEPATASPAPRSAAPAATPSLPAASAHAAPPAAGAPGLGRAPAAAEAPAQQGVGGDVGAGAAAASASSPPGAEGADAPGAALAAAEAALTSLRQRLAEAQACGDAKRQQVLQQLLAQEEPRLAAMRSQPRPGA